jgi:hypothetical protein
MERVDLLKSVHEIPSYEEFFGLLDNEISDDEFEVENKDKRIEELIAIALSFFQEFYLLHMYDSEFYILSDEFKEEVDGLNMELKELLLGLFASYIEEVQLDLDLEYTIPKGTVETDVDLEATIDSAVDTVTDTLYADLKNKATFYKEVAITTGMFALHSNFRRAIKRLTNHIDYNAQYTRNRLTRAYQSFVYGQEALFYWRVSGINTCAWCYDMEAMGAMPLSWFPVDHPNGMCWLEPVLPDVYSDEYLELRGW